MSERGNGNSGGDTSNSSLITDSKPADDKAADSNPSLIADEKSADADKTDKSADADKKPEDADKKPEDKKDDKPVGAPEKYEDFKVPEGVTVDDASLAEFKDTAKGLNLTQEQAQALVDFQAKLSTKQAEAFHSTVAGWAEASRSDKEFGGKDFDANIGLANAFVKQYGTPELLQFVKDWGVGNHPEFVRLCVRAGKAISEGSIDKGSPKPQKSSENFADSLYPSMLKK